MGQFRDGYTNFAGRSYLVVDVQHRMDIHSLLVRQHDRATECRRSSTVEDVETPPYSTSRLALYQGDVPVRKFSVEG